MSKTISVSISRTYKEIVPEMAKDEYERIHHSIEFNGYNKIFPIIINENGIILDGHNRYKICKELGIKPNYVVKSFPNKLEEKRFVIEANFNRRQLTIPQRIRLGREWLEIESKINKLKQIEEGKKFGRGHKKDKTLPANEGKDRHERESSARAAKRVGLSRTTFEKGVKVLEASEKHPRKFGKIWEKVEAGTTVSYAYKKLIRQERKKKERAKPLPKGIFNVLLADPPWEYELNLRGAPDEHYSTMSLSKLKNIKLPDHKNSILFLWATSPQLQEALELLKAWKYKYKTHMIWVKDKIGTGYYFRGQHELLLLGRKGTISVPEEEDRPSSVLHAKRTTHSKKPEEVYGIIEKMYPKMKYLELFARKANPRKRWTYWGNEI